MAVALKLFGLACGAGLVGGGVPLILKNLKNNTESNLQHKTEPVTPLSSENISLNPPNNPPAEKETITNKEHQDTEETVPVVQEQESRKDLIPAQKIETKENCVVLGESQDISDIFEKFNISSDEYTAVSCQKTNKEVGVKISDWKGVFPDDLLVNSWNLNEGNKFSITTETQTLDLGNYRTIFEGNRIVHPIAGKWGDPITTDKGKSVTVVKVPEDSKSIYLLFEGDSIQKDK